MNTPFFTDYPLYLTPLSPIHIGCGEDFEPTNYIVDDNVLYAFDTANLLLNDVQRKELLRLVEMKDALPKIHHFFFHQTELAKLSSRYFCAVSQHFSQELYKKIGKAVNIEANNNKVYNRLEIERHSYLPYDNLPYIPASSFKGAVATAILDYYQQQDKTRGNKDRNDKGYRKLNRNLQKQYLGDFSNSLFSLFKPADFIPKDDSVYSQIKYIVNRKKKSESKTEARGVTVRRECVQLAQYRAFYSKLSFWHHAKKQQNKPHFLTIKEFVINNNQFYRKLFLEEINLLKEKGILPNSWRQETLALLENLQDNLLKSGNIMLTRLGRNGGAESKSYRASNFAEIKIMGKKGERPSFKDKATTVWLAAENENAQANLYPLGWALIELDPKQDNIYLQQWCQSQLPNISFDRQVLLANQQQLRQEKLDQYYAMEQKKKEQEEILKQQEMEKQALLQNASENQKTLLAIIEKLETCREKTQHTNSPIFAEIKTLLGQALENWLATDKHFFVEQITMERIKMAVFISPKAEKELKKQLNKLKN